MRNNISPGLKHVVKIYLIIFSKSMIFQLILIALTLGMNFQ